jgi:hypothetical protein
MTAPARAGTSASRTGTTEREHFPQDVDGTTKTGARGSGTATRTRSPAAERAYARREERRDRSLREDTQRRERRRQPAEPQRQQVRQPKAKQLQAKVATSRVPLVVAVMGLLTTGLLTTLWLAIAAVSGSYQLQESEAQLRSLNEQKQLLIRQNSTMESTPALQRRAIEQGLVPAPEPAHLILRPDGSVSVVGKPEAAGSNIPLPLAGNRPAQPPRQVSPVPAVEGR